MSDQKKMNLTQLTFIVTVNMMGSGIIMLPTNMAKVGAISLLSWVVTALGSLALAWGFAQAGLFNQRRGGLAAYGEDAYGKAGYFQVFLLYFISLAIANVAVASSALGYLSTFAPGLTSTPVITCAGVIALLWITTVANFGGPKLTGRIGALTVWGVILPVGFISFGGWIWFSSSTFAAAWNPQGISLAEGMGSSISLTLWAFLGLESAAQNSNAVENPKRDVPLACMLGTLGAAVVYILSTAVIQGIVPNAELAASNGPFGLAYAKMFSPAVGSVVMVLAVMACLGSLLGWQFTLAQTGKAAADDGMFPAVFAKENRMGAPVVGMIIMGVVQSLMALMTISPNLSEQFSALVNLAVVTNVVPYIIALSALPVMMRAAGVSESKYRSTMAVAMVAMLYSVYAIYAAGKDAVFGGMLVMGLGFIIWGFIANRFSPGKRLVAVATCVALLILGSPLVRAQKAAAPAAPAASSSMSTLDRLRSTSRIRFGYRVDARPFSYKDNMGQAAGFAVALCKKIADAAASQATSSMMAIAWVPVTADQRFTALQQGEIDVYCGPEPITLAARRDVSFSVPIFPAGVGAMMRTDARGRLREILEGRTPVATPVWRANAATALNAYAFTVVAGSPIEPWLAGRMKDLGVTAKVAPVNNIDAGVQAVQARRADVFFGERSTLLDAAKRTDSRGDLVVLDRMFTTAPLALTFRRGEDDFRLLVDSALSRAYSSGEISSLYATWFGAPDANTKTFFQWNAQTE
jgi:putrescine:ornithine antiporter